METFTICVKHLTSNRFIFWAVVCLTESEKQLHCPDINSCLSTDFIIP